MPIGKVPGFKLLPVKPSIGAHIWCLFMDLTIRGVELYKHHPIFYSLGDFAFEPEYITRLPAEAYQRLGLAPDAPIEALSASTDKHMSDLLQNCDAFQAVVALISMANGSLTRARLLPIDLNFGAKDEEIGGGHN